MRREDVSPDWQIAGVAGDAPVTGVAATQIDGNTLPSSTHGLSKAQRADINSHDLWVRLLPIIAILCGHS